MKDVYLHKAAMMEYGPIIDTTVQTAFTLPNGKILVHISKAADMSNSWYTSWPFHPLNPWFDRINRFVESMVETGVKQHIEVKTR